MKEIPTALEDVLLFIFGFDLCQNADFQSLGRNVDVWNPYSPPGGYPGAMVNKQSFLGSFWPWFEAATRLLKVW